MKTLKQRFTEAFPDYFDEQFWKDVKIEVEEWLQEHKDKIEANLIEIDNTLTRTEKLLQNAEINKEFGKLEQTNKLIKELEQ